MIFAHFNTQFNFTRRPRRGKYASTVEKKSLFLWFAWLLGFVLVALHHFSQSLRTSFYHSTNQHEAPQLIGLVVERPAMVCFK